MPKRKKQERAMRVLQKFYLKRQTWVKVGGVLAFLVAVASLYVFGISGL
jgi:hypothetical protein